MKNIKMFMAFFILLAGSMVLAQEVEVISNLDDTDSSGEHQPLTRPRPASRLNESDDIVLDYRGLMQQIDDMRRHEEEVTRQWEDLTQKYEDGLKRLEDTQKALEEELKNFKDWHDQAVKEIKSVNQNQEPTRIEGEILGAPNDRYTSGYPD